MHDSELLAEGLITVPARSHVLQAGATEPRLVLTSAHVHIDCRKIR